MLVTFSGGGDVLGRIRNVQAGAHGVPPKSMGRSPMPTSCPQEAPRPRERARAARGTGLHGEAVAASSPQAGGPAGLRSRWPIDMRFQQARMAVICFNVAQPHYWA